jgi:hypothetical protein
VPDTYAEQNEKQAPPDDGPSIDDAEVIQPAPGPRQRRNSVRIEDFIASKTFYPSVLWINENVVNPALKAGVFGKSVPLGRLIGKATAWSTSTKMHEGKELTSIKLDGAFEWISLETGEIVHAMAAYLPPKWAKLVAAGLDAARQRDPGSVATMVINLGVAATGKPISYRFTIETELDSPVDAMLADIRQLALPALSGPSAPVQIEGKAEAPGEETHFPHAPPDRAQPARTPRPSRKTA